MTDPAPDFALQPLRPDDVPLRVALRMVKVFTDLGDAEIDCLARHSQEGRIDTGDVLAREGDPLDYMTIILEGEIEARLERADQPVYKAWAGMITGALPYSRMTHSTRTVRAVVPTRLALIHKQNFEAILTCVPVLRARLVSVLTDRVRETAKADLQREKLAALGKLSAGLAHELNNPAAAARRAVSGLKEALTAWRRAGVELEGHRLNAEQRRFLASMEAEGPRCTELSRELSPLERSDLEEQFADWMERHGVENGWELAPIMVDSCGDPGLLEQVKSNLPAESLGPALQRTAAAVTLDRLVEEIEDSVGRIAELVQAIKEYTYMDRFPEQEIDLHAGIESTLTMLRHQFKRGVKVVKEFSPEVPKICAHGSELNQVWTNLIDNAVDAMDGNGELRIRTALELDRVMVEIQDNGPGIPPEIQTRVFEPFFTTKPVGEGTGLGLDLVSRIVRNHHGEIQVKSVPGDTRFQIWLPVNYRESSNAAEQVEG